MTDDNEIELLKSRIVSLEQLLDVQEQSVIEQSIRLEKTKEELLFKEKLSVLGEMSGRIAHEILNIMTSVLARIEKKINDDNKLYKKLNHINEVVSDWEKELKNNNLFQYLSQIQIDEKTNNKKTYAEEDIQLIMMVFEQINKEKKENSDDLKFILNNSKRICQVIDELRSRARKTSYIEDININKPIREALEILKFSIEKNGITLVENFTDNLPLIKADFNDLVQVFTNIIKNASHAIIENGNKIKKITIKTNLNNNRIEARIIDTGIGISTDDLHLLFDIGFTKKSRMEGTGYGLHISKTIINKYKGNIEVENSEKGAGTTFLIYFDL